MQTAQKYSFSISSEVCSNEKLTIVRSQESSAVLSLRSRTENSNAATATITIPCASSIARSATNSPDQELELV